MHSWGQSSLYKWKVVFDGTSSVTDFLERIGELRISRGASKSQLLLSAVEIFSGNALDGYRSIKYQIRTWDDLVQFQGYLFAL